MKGDGDHETHDNDDDDDDVDSEIRPYNISLTSLISAFQLDYIRMFSLLLFRPLQPSTIISFAMAFDVTGSTTILHCHQAGYY